MLEKQHVEQDFRCAYIYINDKMFYFIFTEASEVSELHMIAPLFFVEKKHKEGEEYQD